LDTFESWLQLDNFDMSKWNRQQWVEILLKQYGSEIWGAKRKGRRGTKQPVTDFGEPASKTGDK
jgi:hypothetical protein